MDEHVHEWRLYDDGSGAFCIKGKSGEWSCRMDRKQTEARLNATEKTIAWLRLEGMFRMDPDITLDEVDDAKKAMRDAYADMLEGKDA